MTDIEKRGASALMVGRAHLRLAGETSRGTLSTIGFGALGLALVIAIWQIVAIQIGPLRLPDPMKVFAAIPANWQSIPALRYVLMQSGGLEDALLYTVVSAILTVLLGAAAGVTVGLIMPYVLPVRIVMTPVLMVFGTMPVLILLPFLVQWFGNGWLVLSGLVVVFTFVVLATMTQRSMQTAVGRYSDYARSLGASRTFEMIHVALPALTPDIVSGLRVSMAAAWSLQTVAELVGGKHGAGRIIAAMANLSNTTLVIAMVVCLAVTAVGVDAIFALLAKRTQRWAA
jgi:ABC-type nitrate/sulfonate/bicarbonate transport system permease component